MNISNSNPAKLISSGVFLTGNYIWPKNLMPDLRMVQIKRDILKLLTDSVCNLNLTDH